MNKPLFTCTDLRKSADGHFWHEDNLSHVLVGNHLKDAGGAPTINLDTGEPVHNMCNFIRCNLCIHFTIVEFMVKQPAKKWLGSILYITKWPTDSLEGSYLKKRCWTFLAPIFSGRMASKMAFSPMRPAP